MVDALLNVSQGRNQSISRVKLLSGGSGEICWELIQVVGRIQFPTVVEMSPRFLAGCQPEAALYS